MESMCATNALNGGLDMARAVDLALSAEVLVQVVGYELLDPAVYDCLQISPDREFFGP